MDQKFSTAIENQDDPLKHASRLINAHHEPAPWIVLIIEGPRVQGVLVSISDRFISKPVTHEMFARAGVEFKRHGSTRARLRVSRRNDYRSPRGQHVP